jgi:hypothetical protein
MVAVLVIALLAVGAHYCRKSRDARTLWQADVAQAMTFGAFVLAAYILAIAGHHELSKLVVLVGIVPVVTAHLRYRRAYRSGAPAC